jgi:two-component system, OmpR family, sensor kinase
MSLRWRLFLSYGAVVLLTLVVVAFGLAVLLRGYAERVSRDRLELTARPIQVQVNLLLAQGETEQQIIAALQQQSNNSRVYLMFVDANGSVVQEIAPAQLGSIEPRPGSLPASVSSIESGRFRSTDNRVYIYAAFPLTGKFAQLAGANEVVLALPRAANLAVLASLVWPFIAAAVIAIVISLAMSLWLGNTIYKPLAGVSAAAQKMAQGDFSQRVKEEGAPEVKQLAGSFNHMAGEVEKSQTRLRQFVADVSHELKSPLTSIQGFAQALLDGTADTEEARRKAAGIIDSEARRLKRQVDELLELSRMQSGQAKIEREPVDVAEVVSRSAEIYSVQAREKNIALKVSAAPGLVVTGDADRLEQVFNNLMDNAVKNSPAGSEVRITAKRTGDKVRVIVADSGPGIPAEQLSRVFERFYQVPGVRTGVGLGLTIAREIVLAHGGTIEATSPPGEGARFIVSLPVANDKITFHIQQYPQTPA